MSEPLLSVVIPTFNRLRWLPVAVASAIDGPQHDVEVIVVPNGGDVSWKSSLREFSGDTRVVVSPIPCASANAARNHGLKLARGRYVRFLDDDDALFPGASAKQCALLDVSGADICSGTVQLVDEAGAVFRTWKQPPTTDFVESILLPGRVAHPCAHVFRRTSIIGCRWDETVSLGQDTHWMHSLCRQREWNWINSEVEAGIWRHHPAPRISSGARRSLHLQVSAQCLLDTAISLESQGRLDARRRAAAVAGLWRLVHSGFFMAPGHWTAVMRATQRIGPGTFPDIALYRGALGRLVPPLVLEWMMVPKRWLNHRARARAVRDGRMTPVLPP
jgi:hypothetical protein